MWYAPFSFFPFSSNKPDFVQWLAKWLFCRPVGLSVPFNQPLSWAFKVTIQIGPLMDNWWTVKYWPCVCSLKPLKPPRDLSEEAIDALCIHFCCLCPRAFSLSLPSQMATDKWMRRIFFLHVFPSHWWNCLLTDTSIDHPYYHRGRRIISIRGRYRQHSMLFSGCRTLKEISFLRLIIGGHRTFDNNYR